MKKIKKLKIAINNFMYDHYVLKRTLEYLWALLFAVAGAAVFAFGFCSFITTGNPDDFNIITGGVSGLSQVTTLIFSLVGINPGDNLINSIGYFVFNIPILIFAWFKIGKRFAIFTLINVALTSLLISVFTGVCHPIAASEFLNDNILARILFGAICTGVSSAIAFKADISCGGIDVVSYYVGMKKSTTVGKYNILINAIIILTYSILMVVQANDQWVDGVFSALYSVIYLFICGLVIDQINVRNKKVQLQIITSNSKMAGILLAYFPHGATIGNAIGAYTHAEREVIWMVVSTSEVKRVIKVAKKVDDHVFISAIPLNQVYGNFFSKPVE